MRGIGYILVVLAMFWTFVQIGLWAPTLPERVASHFGPNGVADHWMPKDQFLKMQLGLQLIIPIFMLGIAKLSHVLPDSLLNMPNKQYWLHADRRTETLDYNQQILVMICGLTTVLLAIVFQLTYAANANGRQMLQLNYFVPALIGYMVAVFAVVGITIHKFSRRPKDDTASS